MASTRTELIEIQPDIKISAFISSPKGLSEQVKKPTVVFLHFWGGSRRTWSLVTPCISAIYPTIALDFRGWGDSTGPDDPAAYSIVALANDVRPVLRALHVNRFILVGLSMGGKVAQLVASQICSSDDESEQRMTLLGVVLISPAPPTPLTLTPEMRLQQLHAYDDPASATFVATNVLTTSFQSRDLPDFVVNDMLGGNKWAREAWPAYAMEEDISGEMRRIAAPILVLAAEKDLVEPVERVKQEVCGLFPAAELKVLLGSGHLSPLDAPEAVADAIIQFLMVLPN